MTDITSTSEPSFVEMFAALAEKMLDRFNAHETRLVAAEKADKDAEAKASDLADKLAASEKEVADLKAQLAKQTDTTPLQAVMAKMQAAVDASEDPAPTPAPASPVTQVDTPIPAVAAVVADTGAPAEHVAPAVEAHADALSNGSTPEVAHAEAQAAAAQAGAEPEVAVQIADSVATQPAPEAAPVL